MAEVPDQLRDLFFDEWLMPGGPSLHAITRWVVDTLEGIEVRQRGRRSADQLSHEELIGAIVSNLARAVLLLPEAPSVAVVKSRNEARRYRRPALRQLPRALQNLEEVGLLAHHAPRKPGLTGTIKPAAVLVNEVRGAKVGFADIARHAGEEVLELRLSFHDRRGGGRPEKRREPLPVPNNPRTEALRREVRNLNEYLAQADITIAGGAEANRIDNFDRRLHRHFTVLERDELPRWNRNGRLFGGFWQTLPKTRRHLIRIDGTMLADLDFRNLFLRLAYCKVGIEPPPGDLYAALGFEERHRAGVKALVSAFLFARKRRWAIPASLVEKLPLGLTVTEARDALLSAHPRLEGVIERGLGFSLMHTESRILIDCLHRLFKAGITALPMHDGLMVARSRAKDARNAMLASARSVAGFELPVKTKRIEVMEDRDDLPFLSAD